MDKRSFLWAHSFFPSFNWCMRGYPLNAGHSDLQKKPEMMMKGQKGDTRKTADSLVRLFPLVYAGILNAHQASNPTTLQDPNSSRAPCNSFLHPYMTSFPNSPRTIIQIFLSLHLLKVIIPSAYLYHGFLARKIHAPSTYCFYFLTTTYILILQSRFCPTCS